MVAAAVPASAESPPRPLRVVTLNLLHAGPWSGWRPDTTSLDARLAMVTDELRALAPDVIAVQEASRTRRSGVVAKRLAEALGYQYVFEPATTRLTPITVLNRLIVTLLGFSEGPAVISRFPIASSEVYELPRCRNRLDPRIMLRADVRTPWGSVAVFNTHTTADPCQVERIAEILQDAPRGPFLVTGDFNMSETNDTMQALVRWRGLVDAFRAVHPDAPGPTVYQRPWAPTSTVSRRVDFIFVGGVPEADRSVCDSRVIVDAPRREADGRTLWPSDHYGVLADIGVFGIKCAP
jgi:endonuclease/exonuclease/phosphatase family metal-dependent hydrolase